jgi:hypothetical protein
MIQTNKYKICTIVRKKCGRDLPCFYIKKITTHNGTKEKLYTLKNDIFNILLEDVSEETLNHNYRIIK